MKNNNDFESIPKHIDFYSERLKFLWEQYIKIIQLVLILSGATIITTINLTMTKMSKFSIAIKEPNLAVYSIVLASIAGLLALGWRFAAQILMEKQIFGDKETALRYFELTKTDKPWALNISAKGTKRLELIHSTLKFTSGPLLLISWIPLIIFFQKNII